MNYKIIAKYVQDLRFNISKPDIFLTLSKNISNYKFKIDIKSNRFKDNVIEIKTSLLLVPKSNDLQTIEAVVTLSTLVELDKN